MAYYDVRCDKCGYVWEERKTFDSPPGDCDKCGSSFTTTLMPLPGMPRHKDPIDNYISDYTKPKKTRTHKK